MPTNTNTTSMDTTRMATVADRDLGAAIGMGMVSSAG
jgi:hypothetical protein